MLAQTLVLALLAALVIGHGCVEHIIHNGEFVRGWSTADGWDKATPIAIGWATTALDGGWLGPADYDTPNMVCHKDATNGNAHTGVSPGDIFTLQWTKDFDHSGPIVNYMARCEDTICEEVDKTILKFFKISEEGLLDGTKGEEGYWATDVFRENDSQWKVQIPENLAAGNYILRHEIIALHNAQDGAPQHYPQCINLQITGDGTLMPEGVLAGEIYDPDAPGLKFNLYDGSLKENKYEIPGVVLIPEASPVDQGSNVKPTATREPSQDVDIPTREATAQPSETGTGSGTRTGTSTEATGSGSVEEMNGEMTEGGSTGGGRPSRTKGSTETTGEGSGSTGGSGDSGVSGGGPTRTATNPILTLNTGAEMSTDATTRPTTSAPAAAPTGTGAAGASTGDPSAININKDTAIYLAAGAGIAIALLILAVFLCRRKNHSRHGDDYDSEYRSLAHPLLEKRRFANKEHENSRMALYRIRDKTSAKQRRKMSF